MNRCWPDSPQHISNLYNVGAKRTVQYMADGLHTIDDIPPEKRLPAAAQRQLRAMEEGRLLREIRIGAGLTQVELRASTADFPGWLYDAAK